VLTPKYTDQGKTPCRVNSTWGKNPNEKWQLKYVQYKAIYKDKVFTYSHDGMIDANTKQK